METKSAVKTPRDLYLFRDLRPGDIAIDCGANVGLVTQQMAAHGATVYASEPNPHAFRTLRETFLAHPNVHCRQVAVLDRKGKARLFFHERSAEDPLHWSTGSSLLEIKRNIDPKSAIEVEVIDLVTFIRDLRSPVALLKLDVEGVEAPIIHRLIDTGTIEKVATIVVETHEKKIPELRPAIARLRERIASLGLSKIHLDWQ